MKKVLVKKPKIAILTLHPSNGGGVLSLIKVICKFCKIYFEPTLFFLNFDRDISTNLRNFKFSSSFKKNRYFGVESIEIGAKYAFWEPGHYKFTLNHWRNFLKDYKYFFVASGTPIAAHPLLLLNKEFVIWFAAIFDEDRRQRELEFSPLRKMIDNYSKIVMRGIEKDILKNANFIFALSRYTKKTIERLVGRKYDGISICPYPINMLSRNKSLLDMGPSKKRDVKNVIAVGRFQDPRKNLDMLLKVFDKLDKIFLNFNMYIIGIEEINPRLNIFYKYRQKSNIKFLGRLKDSSLEYYYRFCDLMLITSYQEGFGIVGLEALSYGTPVVSTRCGGVSDFIIEGKNGFLVDVNDVDDMVAKAALMLRDDKKIQKMSKFAIDLVKQDFSEHKVFSRFKYGLSCVYPELADFFEEMDINKGKNLPAKKLYDYQNKKQKCLREIIQE